METKEIILVPKIWKLRKFKHYLKIMGWKVENYTFKYKNGN